MFERYSPTPSNNFKWIILETMLDYMQLFNVDKFLYTS
jgi:hypothetical protein